LWLSKEASATWGRPWNAVEKSAQNAMCWATSPTRFAGGACAWVTTTRSTSGIEWYNPLWLYDKPRYVREHVFPQFKDLVTHNKPSFIFSDGEWEMSSADWHSAELLASLFNESPVKDEVVINDRWGGDTRHKHGGYWTTEYTAGMSAIDHAWEESRSIGVSPFRFSIYSIAAFWKANLTGESSAFLKLDRWIIIINATPLFMSIQT
jgi:alpha-L-fucosidase